MHRHLQSRSVLLVVLAGLCVVGSARIVTAQGVEAQPAVMIYPAEGEIIDTVARPFEWTTGFALATIRLRVSLYPSAESTGQPFVFDSGAIGATSVAMPASLPRGQTLYVTLTSQAQATAISFTRTSTFYLGPGREKATLLYPGRSLTGAGNVITGSRAVEWTRASGAVAYRLIVAAACNCMTDDSIVFDSGWTAAIVAPLPDSVPRATLLVAKLYTQYIDGPEALDSTRFWIVNRAVSFYRPRDAAHVRASLTFQWTPGTPGVGVRLLVGSTPGGSDIASSPPLDGGSQWPVRGLPPGRDLFARVTWTAEGEAFSSDLAFHTEKPLITPADFGGEPGEELLLYDPITGAYRVQWSGPVSDYVVLPSVSGLWSPGWDVHRGDFNADGYTDLFFYNPQTGRAIEGINKRTGDFSFTYTEFAWSPGWTVTVADLNGDGRSDVFVYNPATGRWIRCITQPNGSFALTNSGVWSPDWSVSAAEFNKDGRADLFLYNGTSDANHGRWFRVLSNADESFTYLEGEVRWSSDWTLTVADFDGDGLSDVFVYRPTTGHWYRVTFTAGGTRYQSGLWSAGWTIHAGDTDGDRRSDLFVVNPVTGRALLVVTRSDGSFWTTSLGWGSVTDYVISVRDVDGDGDDDIYPWLAPGFTTAHVVR